MLISKDESLKDSMVHIGYHILRCLDAQNDARMPIVDVMLYLKKRYIHDYRSIQFALVFLHSVGAIDFRAPYVYRISEKEEGSQA